jgi:hypothetical protein
MQTDTIAEIAVDEKGRLCVRPATTEFPLIYRAAMQVGWDSQGRFLFSPVPTEWSYVDWFKQIAAAARDEYGCALVITKQTSWRGVEPALQIAILAV